MLKITEVYIENNNSSFENRLIVVYTRNGQNSSIDSWA